MTRVVSTIPTSPTTVVVNFESSVVGTPYYLEPNSYKFSNGLETLGVLLVDESVVELQTTPQIRDVAYDLEVRVEEEA